MSNEANFKPVEAGTQGRKGIGSAFGAGRPGRPKAGLPEGSPRQKKAVRLRKEQLDEFTTQLLEWVAKGCTDADWASLLGRAAEPGCPPWLDKKFVSLNDLSHRVLAVSLAFLVHQQGALAKSPFAGESALTGESLLHRLSLPAPGGVYQLSECLAWDRQLRRRGWVELDNEWSARRMRKGQEAISVARLMKMEISLSVSMLGALLGLPDLEEEDEGPVLDDLTLPEEVWNAIAGILQGPYPTHIPRWIYLKGPEHSGRRTLAKALAQTMGKKLKVIGPGDGAYPGAFVLVDVHRGFDEDDWAKARRHTSWVFLRGEGANDSINIEGRANLVLDLGALEDATRNGFWADQLKKAGSRFSACDPAEFSSSSAPPGAVIEALQKIAQEAELRDLDPVVTKARLLEAVHPRAEAAQDGEFVERIAPKRTLQELCLATEASHRFKQIVASIRGRGAMLNKWNLDPGLVGQAQGIALFHGPSGTGKSMAAEVLAQELGMPLLRVEATSLVGPYVGESEHQVHEFFSQAAGRPAVLLLDEADSFLADRGRTEGSTRQYYHSLVNCWLRELQKFTGILVMTTNHAAALDPAIERRIQFRLAFDAPGSEVRERIWKSFLDQAPIPGKDGLDLRAVATQFNLSGGRIRNAFLGACHRAAEIDSINQSILIEACEEELRSSMPIPGSKTIRGFALA